MLRTSSTKSYSEMLSDKRFIKSKYQTVNIKTNRDYKEVLEIEKKSDYVKLITESLDYYEIFEWAHLKELKATSLFKKKKFDQCYETLVEVLTGINENNFKNSQVY